MIQESHGFLDAYICMYVCMYRVCMYVCMYVRMYVCMYVCMYRVCMYAYHPYHTIYALTFAGLNFCRVKLLRIADFSNFCVFISVDAGS